MAGVLRDSHGVMGIVHGIIHCGPFIAFIDACHGGNKDGFVFGSGNSDLCSLYHPDELLHLVLFDDYAEIVAPHSKEGLLPRKKELDPSDEVLHHRGSRVTSGDRVDACHIPDVEETDIVIPDLLCSNEAAENLCTVADIVHLKLHIVGHEKIDPPHGLYQPVPKLLLGKTHDLVKLEIHFIIVHKSSERMDKRNKTLRTV